MRFPKPRPKLLERREKQADLRRRDKAERVRCKVRSGGWCEVIVCEPKGPVVRCARPATENHHLIGGSGKRNKGKSLFAEHRLHVCARCHSEINGKVLVPVDGTEAEDAATVRYERRQ